MKNRFSFIYTSFAILFYLFCICFFSLNIFFEYKNGEERNEKLLTELISEIKITNKAPVFPENDLTSFNSLSIYSNGNEIFYFSRNNLSNSSLIKNKTYAFETSTSKFFIDANVYLLRPYSIFYYARISFILILIFSFITISLIVLLPSKTSVSDLELNIDYENNDSEISNEDNTDDVIIEEEVKENSEILENSEITVTEENDIKPEEQTTEQSVQEENPIENIDNNESENYIEEIQEFPEMTPEGLFSPVTGFGWESYLKDRLDNEINRCISSESDLAVYIICIPKLPRTSEIIKSVCDYLLVQFQFKDLIFEYKDDCFVVLQNNTNIDSALNMADKLIEEINSLIEADSGKCFIGITTKSIRIVSGERLLKEASEALNHAKESAESSIVGFQVNSDKYLEFVEKQN